MFDAAKQVAANGNSSTSTTTTQVVALEHDLRLIEKNNSESDSEWYRSKVLNSLEPLGEHERT